MALRVVRGLFRLWLILSVLWIAGVAFVGREKFTDIDRIEQAMSKSPMEPPVESKDADTELPEGLTLKAMCN